MLGTGIIESAKAALPIRIPCAGNPARAAVGITADPEDGGGNAGLPREGRSRLNRSNEQGEKLGSVERARSRVIVLLILAGLLRVCGGGDSTDAYGLPTQWIYCTLKRFNIRRIWRHTHCGAGAALGRGRMR